MANYMIDDTKKAALDKADPNNTNDELRKLGVADEGFGTILQAMLKKQHLYVSATPSTGTGSEQTLSITEGDAPAGWKPSKIEVIPVAIPAGYEFEYSAGTHVEGSVKVTVTAGVQYICKVTEWVEA